MEEKESMYGYAPKRLFVGEWECPYCKDVFMSENRAYMCRDACFKEKVRRGKHWKEIPKKERGK